MGSEISSPILDILRRARESKATSPITELRKRMDGASDVRVALLDISGSMDDVIGLGGMSKYDHLKIAIKDVLQYHPGLKLVAFNDRVVEVKTLERLPQPNGGTNLGNALDFVAQWKPAKTIIVSDGLPDDEDHAKQAADKLTGIVDTIYCGPDGHPAEQFLRTLAHSCGGTSYEWDGYRELSSVVRGLLG